MNPEPRKGKLAEWKTAADLSSVGLTLALSIAVGIGFGLLLDHWFKTRWLVIAGTLLGVVAGFQQLIQAVIRANADEERKEQEARTERAADTERARNAGENREPNDGGNGEQ